MEPGLFDYIKRKLPAPNEREALETIAKGADVPYHTLLKIANGETVDPRVSTVENLTRYFRQREAA